ncbi:MAG: 4-hydroxyphenylacetate 3-hydroxylase N-terminal domain-containing protein [Candidatus Jordarchaeaceae archaeon]
MVLKTREEYIESLKKIKPTVYILGEKVDRVWDNLLFQSSINHGAKTYDFFVR